MAVAMKSHLFGSVRSAEPVGSLAMTSNSEPLTCWGTEMGLNSKCPKCQWSGPLLRVDQELHEEALVVCHQCPVCRHKWLEVYELHSARPTNEKESTNGSEQ